MRRGVLIGFLMAGLLAAPGRGGAQQPPVARPSAGAPPATGDLAAAYYHFMLARYYQYQAEYQGKADLVPQAIAQYRAAMHADPTSAYLPVEFAGLLFRAGQTGDAIRLARSVVQEHPQNADGRELLGELYLRLLGDGSDSQGPQLAKLALEQFQVLARLRPDDPDVHFTLGRLYRTEGNLDAAEAEMQTVRRLTKGAPAAVANLVMLYAEQGKLDAAEQVFQSVPKADRSASLQAAMAGAYERQHLYSQAAGAYQQAVLLDPGNLDYHRGWARSLFYAGDLPAARAQYEWITAADARDASAWVRMAEVDRRLGHLSEADAELTKARALAPDSVEVSYFSADLYAAEGKPEQAAQAMRHLLAITARPDGKYPADEASERTLLYERLGVIERQAGQYPAALAAFEQMEALDSPESPRAVLEISETYRQQHDFARAVSAAAAGVKQYPADRGLAVNYAMLLADTGQSRLALATMKPWLKGTPADRPIYLAIAQINERARNWKAAERAIQSATTLAANDRERAVSEFMLGDIADRRKKFSQAEVHLRKALQLDPHNALALNYLGYLLADQGKDLQQALEYTRQAVHAESENGAYLDSLGWVYLKLRQLPQATKNLQAAVRLQPNDPVILGHLAEAYYLEGNLRAAAESWRQALAEWSTSAPADYDPAEVERARKSLASVSQMLARQGQADKPASTPQR